MYCAEYLQTTHRRDLASTDLEAIWVQIKFPTTSALFSVIHRSKLECPNFFEDIYGVFEKAWIGGGGGGTPIHYLYRYVPLIGFYTSCSDISQKLPQKFAKVAHFTKKLLKSCFLSTQQNQFLLLMKVNLCTSIRVIYLFIYSFLLADISIPTEMIF